jgi:type II secretory pathway component GspD/PulD (secretin)
VGVLLALAGLAAAASADEKKGPPVVGKAPEKRVQFELQAVPWKKVFEWLADQTGLPVVANTVPTGTFTFVAPARGKGPRTFTIPEVIDIVNEALLSGSQTQKYYLIKRERNFIVVPADESFDAALAPLISPDSVSAHPRTAIVRMLLPLHDVEAKEALAAVKSLLGPFGQALPVGKRLLVRDTVANLRQVIRVLQEVGDVRDTGTILDHRCAWIKAAEARAILEELLGKPGQTKTGRTYSLAIDERTNTVHVRGSAELVSQARAILAKIDVSKGQGPIVPPSPILKIYTVSPGSAEPLVKTLQEAYRGSSTQISTVGSNRIMVYATPEDQLAIAGPLQAEMPAPPPTIEVVPLTSLNASRTLESIRTLLGAGRSAPVLLADSERNALIVRGTREQVGEVKAALKALGESGAPAGGVRVITLERGDAATLAEEIQRLLQNMRPNPVRVIVPGGKPAPAPRPVPAGKAVPAAKKKSGKPVTLTALGNKLLVASDDPQVVALVQELVRLFNVPVQSGPEVIRLQYATAVDVARTLDELFNGRAGPGTAARLKRVQIVAEPITNSLLIQASPLDLLTIRRLLSKSLDVMADHSDTGAQTYVLGPLRHANAADVAKVLRDVYKDSKPAVTIAVDPRTGTVILRGPASVYQDARKLLIQLDVKAEKK